MKNKRMKVLWISLLLAFLIGIAITVVLAYMNVEQTGKIYMLIELLFMVIAAVASFFITRYYEKNIIKPFGKLCDGLKEVSKGNFSVEIDCDGEKEHDENIVLTYENFNKMTAELRSAELMKIDFFSDVSHEFKTPISSIDYSVALLKKENLSDEQLQYVTTIESATKKLNSMVGNMLKLNRVEHNNIAVAFDEFGLCEQLEACLIAFESEMDEKKLELETNFEKEITIRSDKELWHIVWTNIISNAIKFSNDNGKICVNIYDDELEVCVEIIDNGIGMDAQTVEHSFDKFYQADKSRITAGNGLGLSLVKKITFLLGSEVAIISEPDNGTTVSVRIKK